MNIIEELEKEHAEELEAKRAIPEFAPGDSLRVNVKVVEAARERIQAYEGVCISRSGAGLNESFTVRKISYGEGVERVFPVQSSRSIRPLKFKVSSTEAISSSVKLEICS